MSDDERARPEQPAGDPACWLNRVCAECGAFVEDDSGTCWRCGTALSEE